MKTKCVIPLLVLILLGCKDEFVLKSDTFEQVMVVDGLISNQPGPYTIKLSLTAPINSDAFIPLEGYTVTLQENTGESEVLTESEPGNYVTSDGGIQGIVGNEYSISIISPDGDEYQSDFQELVEPVEIESLYGDIDTIISVNYPFKIPGYQFYVDTKLATTHDNYFLWSLTETFEYDSDYAFYAYESRFGKMYYSAPDIEELRTCWKTQKVKYLFTGNTSELSTPKILRQPLHFVSTETKKLSKKYSVLLTQYTIGEKAYKYWQEIEDILSQDNILVSTQPYNVTGNIKNVNNPKEKVYGYFTVASVSETRIFIDRPQLKFYYKKCQLFTDPEDIGYFKRGSPPPYYWVLEDEGLALVGSVECLECTSEGGTIIMPDFWIY